MNCDRAFCIALVSGRWLSVGLLRDPRGARHWGVFRHRIGTPKVVGHHTDMTAENWNERGVPIGTPPSRPIRIRISTLSSFPMGSWFGAETQGTGGSCSDGTGFAL